MQTASRQAGFGTEQHGLSMRQHNDHHPESEKNIEAQDIADIINGLAQSVSEDKETIISAFNDMTVIIQTLQEKNREKLTKQKTKKTKNMIILTILYSSYSKG